MHLEIATALVLSDCFGVLFPVNQDIIKITYSLEEGEVPDEEISEWDILIFHREDYFALAFFERKCKGNNQILQ